MVDPEKECQSCLKDRVEAGLDPLQKIALPSRTTKKNLEVLVCPHCDNMRGRYNV